MTTRFKQPGNTLDYTPSADVAAGDILVVGNCIAIAPTDIAANEMGAVDVEGVFEVPKATGTAWNLGDSVDYDVSATNFGKGITPATGDVTKAAVCAKAAAAADATAWIKLTPGTGTLN
jgi:predicted RecA/RadA family phage recombinase